MSENKYCSTINQFIEVFVRVESSKSIDGTFCPFFCCSKLIIFRCRSPPFINFELEKFEIDRRK